MIVNTIRKGACPSQYYIYEKIYMYDIVDNIYIYYIIKVYNM